MKAALSIGDEPPRVAEALVDDVTITPWHSQCGNQECDQGGHHCHYAGGSVKNQGQAVRQDQKVSGFHFVTESYDTPSVGGDRPFVFLLLPFAFPFFRSST